MKRRITLSIALALSIVLVTLMSFDSKAQAQSQESYVTDTGIITLGPNQELRLSVVSVDGELGGGIYGVRFRQMNYTQGICNGGICKQTIASQNTSDLITLTPGEAATFTCIPGSVYGVRGVVLSSSRDVQVNVMIIDRATGEVLSIDKSTPKLMESSFRSAFPETEK